jgi:glutamate--cysteine ligase
VSTYQPGDRTPITRCSQLTDLFAPHAPREGRVGLELELLPVTPSGHLVPYAGAGGVEEALSRLSPPHEAVEEASHITALKPRAGGMLGLEPGAQVEIASPPADSLAELEDFLQRMAGELEASAAASGFRLAPWGVAPMDGEEDLPDVPKARYGILREHLLSAGSMGRRMMKLTASTQVSFDYRDEPDLTRMVRIAATALPYVLAYTANGPVYRGRKTRWATQRPKIWRGTDRKRCGLPAFLFDAQVTYAAAARWAAGRPLILMVRDGRFLPGDGRTFAQWLRDPGERGPVTVEDWELHVSTLFPDLRLRSYLEIRVLDALPLPLVMSIAALFKGLFATAGGSAVARSGLPFRGRTALGRAFMQAARHGPRWVPDDGPAPADAAHALLGAAAVGLRSLGEDPCRLDPLRDLVSAGVCPADRWGKEPSRGWSGPTLHGTQD